MKLKSSLLLLSLASTAFVQAEIVETLAYPGQGSAISNNGLFVVGYEYKLPGAPSTMSQAFLFTTADASEKPLLGPGVVSGVSFGVGNDGAAVGATSTTGTAGWVSSGSQAAVWTSSGAYTNLHSFVNTGTAPTASGAAGFDSSSGWTVGAATNGAANADNAALWRNSGGTYTYTNLHDAVVAAVPAATSSQANAINANKTIAGTLDNNNNLGVWTTSDAGASYSFTNLHSVAQRASDGAVATMTQLGGYAGTISDNGSIVGLASFAGVTNAGLWKADSINGTTYTYTDLHAQIATSGKTAIRSSAFAINSDATNAVGSARIGGKDHASLWDLTTNSFSDLNEIYASQLASEKFQYLSTALDIADSGEITGFGYGTDLNIYGFLIDQSGTLHNIGMRETVVIPEPSSSLLLGLASISFLVRRKRK